MINFNMNKNENFASFKDDKTGLFVFVDSYDNNDFDVRIGSLEDSKLITTIHALDAKDLNEKLTTIYQKVC